MSLAGLLTVLRCMMRVAAGSMSVMGGFFVLPALVMFRGFCMMVRCVGMVLCGLLMMLSCLCGHCYVSSRPGFKPPLLNRAPLTTNV
jgi:hypothetical protein